MLVLTRTPGQSLVLVTEAGDYITVRIADIRNRQVRLSVSAPEHLRISRNDAPATMPRRIGENRAPKRTAHRAVTQ